MLYVEIRKFICIYEIYIYIYIHTCMYIVYTYIYIYIDILNTPA